MMNRRLARRDSPGKRRRLGSLSVLSVFAIIACGVCVALVINSVHLTTLRSESQQCAEAAALAGCRALLCDQMLCQNAQPFEAEGRIVECRQTAVQVAGLYQSGWRLPAIDDGDIRVAQRVFTEGSAGPVLLEHSTAPNLVEVTLTNSSPSDHSGRLFLSGITGVRRGRLLASASAVMENRIAGFVARSNNAVPLAPFAVPDDSRTIQSGCWSVEIEMAKGADNWAWSESDNQVVREADRLPEITLALAGNGIKAAPGQLLPVGIVASVASPQQLINQLQAGLTRSHLQSLPNSMLTFPVTGTAVRMTAPDVQQFAAQLESLVGEIRIFPTSDVSQTAGGSEGDDKLAAPDESQAEDDNSAEQGGVTLTRPVAARIMNVRREGSSGLQVTLQPCVISTATAVISDSTSDPPANPYIWKIMLVRSR